MAKERELATATLSIILASLVSTAPARAWCERVCALAKEGQCVEYRTTCYGESTPAPRSSYGAIAFSPGSGSFGYSDNYANRTQAENRAKSECGKNDCKIATWFFNQCGALAISGNGSWGADHSGREQGARSLALARCAKEGGTNCEIKVIHCSR
ncbi:MAG TPA: DUF4189 domain-containing protein [Xanthobacteraceae bacterium]|nr:DUF4189 domain-containing protein [Xanthobacteraceae bacterium]